VVDDSGQRSIRARTMIVVGDADGMKRSTRW
jgi:hypothetical protein